MNNPYGIIILILVLASLFFNGPAQKADIKTKQERYTEASSFLDEFGYSAKEIEQILNQK